jgi:hypothetical protein
MVDGKRNQPVRDRHRCLFYSHSWDGLLIETNLMLVLIITTKVLLEIRRWQSNIPVAKVETISCAFA